MNARQSLQHSGSGSSAATVHDIGILEQFFDADWYLEAYPDVKGFDGELLEHYLRFGQAEGRSPHPLFDPGWYLSRHPELGLAAMEPMTYYFTRGWRRSHGPHPAFDPAWYLPRNVDLLVANVDPLRHYLESGWSEGRTLHPLFDTSWYLETYPEVARRQVDPLCHFLTHGWKAGHRPHPLFDPAWYQQENPDVARAGINPWLHYIRTGWREGRSPHPLFDARWYLENHLAAGGEACEPLAHYLSEGWRRGLRPSPDAPQPFETGGDVAPLYSLAVKAGKSGKNRGTVVLVLHETEVGGAPQVLKLFAMWMRDRTRFDIRLVSLHGGNLREQFAAVAPLLVLGEHPEASRADVLKEWVGDRVVGVFLNSVASGNFLKYAPPDLPTLAFIHELPRVLEHYPEQIALIRRSADRIIAGGPEVMTSLREGFGFPAETLVAAHSFIEALPNGTDAVRRRRAARAALGIPHDRFVVMGCGTVHWRKSPDKFIETAEHILRGGIDAEFVWLGGGSDLEACKALVTMKGLQDRVRFVGYEPDVPGKLAAGDVFVLSSQEDPFPLVALYAAQAGLPIVCFRDAGGIEGFVADGCGIAVPHMDTLAMAEAVRLYATDPARRRRDGAAGTRQVEDSYTIDAVGPVLLHHLREVMQVAPEVSVVVPNFNYETYLPERLRSISDQTFQDFEVILLDDASTDGSVGLLEEFARLRPGTRVVANAENSGSPFIQWKRGMDLARSDLVWLAEADDRCKPELLATLLPAFDDRNVRLAYCASRPVTSSGEVIGDYRPLYLDRITPGRWNYDYVATDHEEANAGLGIANSIPNASAVVFRKFSLEPEFLHTLSQMRLCGDWYFYVRAIRGGLIAFSAAVLNDHRRHDNTVTRKLEGSLRYFSELAAVRDYLGRTYRQGDATKARIAEFLAQDIARFGVDDPETLPKAADQEKAMPTLLVVAPDLSPGGGQVFSISLANEWVRRGGRAILLNVGNQPSHRSMLEKIGSGVMLLEASAPGTELGTLVKRFDIDVIHSSIWWADRWVDNNRAALPDDMPWIITMHGCHETILAHPGIDQSFPERLQRMIDRATWVYTADKNLKVFETYGRPANLSKIPNGMPEEPVQRALSRAEFGFRDEAVLLCLASRAIPEKGWHEAVRLTERLNREGYKVDLMLIGEGPAADAIRQENPPNVRLIGQVPNLQDYLAIADIGLLPSYFVGESLPLVLLEMMAKALPIVASEIGEIPWILGRGEDAAGVLVPLAGQGVDEEALYHATLCLMDQTKRNTVSAAAQTRFKSEFTLEQMSKRYEETYRRVTSLT